MTNGDTAIINLNGEAIKNLLDSYLNDIDPNTKKGAEAGDWTTPIISPVDPEHHTAEEIAKWNEDSQKLTELLKKWDNLFGTKTPDEINKELTELKNKPAGTITPTEQEKLNKFDGLKTDYDKLLREVEELRKKTSGELSDKDKEAINNYEKVKDALKPWTDLFGTLTTAQQIKDKLDAKPTGGKELSAEEKEAIANYISVKDRLSKWLTSFPTNIFKDKENNPKTPAEIRQDYNDLEGRLNTAIGNLQTEQGKNKTLTEDIEKLKNKLGSPLENLIEQKLREVIITEEWNYPYLVRSLESFLTWRSSEDKQKRVLVYKYWNTIRKNIEWLKHRLGGVLNEY